MPEGLHFKLADCLDLVEWSGRVIREDKRGAIAASAPPLLERLQIDPDNWKTLTTQFERSFKTFVGEPEKLARTTLSLGYQRSPGLSACRALLQ